MARKPSVPTYRLHRPSGRAVVTLNGRDLYLGVHDSPQSRTEYQRVIGEWLASHRTPPDAAGGCDLSLAEVMLAYLAFAGSYYLDEVGRPTREVDNIRAALRPMEELYALTLVSNFGPVALKAVRQRMVDAGLTRRVVNQRVGVIKRMFKWAGAEELIPPAVSHALTCVDGLRRGRSAAKDRDPVRPVPAAAVEAVLPLVSRGDDRTAAARRHAADRGLHDARLRLGDDRHDVGLPARPPQDAASRPRPGHPPGAQGTGDPAAVPGAGAGRLPVQSRRGRGGAIGPAPGEPPHTDDAVAAAGGSGRRPGSGGEAGGITTTGSATAGRWHAPARPHSRCRKS